jgi:hypothetical protein
MVACVWTREARLKESNDEQGYELAKRMQGARKIIARIQSPTSPFIYFLDV